MVQSDHLLTSVNHILSHILAPDRPVLRIFSVVSDSHRVLRQLVQEQLLRGGGVTGTNLMLCSIGRSTTCVHNRTATFGRGWQKCWWLAGRELEVSASLGETG